MWKSGAGRGRHCTIACATVSDLEALHVGESLRTHMHLSSFDSSEGGGRIDSSFPDLAAHVRFVIGNYWQLHFDPESCRVRRVRQSIHLDLHSHSHTSNNSVTDTTS